MNNISFIIEDGYNTSYIDSLLIALFHNNTHVCDILNRVLTENNKYMCLQDMITNIIENIRRNYSINSSFINEIRNFSFICGWKYGLGLQNVVEYYDFLMKGFECDGIDCEIYSQNSGITRTLKTNYIELEIDHDTDTKNLLNNWIKKNLLIDKNSLYHFKKLPTIIAMNLKRDVNHENACVDLKKKIRFNGNGNSKQLEATWTIHSIICYSSSNNGKYYTILPGFGGWSVFVNDKIPSFSKLEIDDKVSKKKIMQECVLVLYRLDIY